MLSSYVPGSVSGFVTLTRDTWRQTQGFRTTQTRNKVFSDSVVGRDYHLHTLYVPQVVVAFSYCPVPWCYLWVDWSHYHEVLTWAHAELLSWTALSLSQSGPEWDSSWTRSDIHTRLVCYPNMSSIDLLGGHPLKGLRFFCAVFWVFSPYCRNHWFRRVVWKGNLNTEWSTIGLSPHIPHNHHEHKHLKVCR